MKKTIALLAIAGFAAATNAQLLTETFDYTDGNLVGNGGWTNHSGSESFIQVDSGVAVLGHGGGSREDAGTNFAATAGTIYYGIDFKVSDDAPISGTDFEYFAHFMTDGLFNFRGRLDVVAGNSGGDFTVGIASTSGTADAVWATDLSFDTYYRAIVGYDQVAGQAQLWIDAVSASDTSILAAAAGTESDLLDRFALRQSNSSSDETIMVDNLIVGGSFESVVPTPASAALLGLGGLAATRRRRG